jgi:V8-like Glu-specific endopeptidase
MSKWDHGPLASLNEILANLYPKEADARRLAAKAGLRTAQIDFDGSSLSRWFNILDHANPRDMVDAIVASAVEENPDDEALRQARNHAPPPVVKGPETQWAGPAGASQLEKIMGDKSTLVPITYLEIGLLRSRAVVRIKRQDGSSGTGFVTAGNILITNNHVLPSAELAKSSVVQFNYQHTAEGLDAKMEEASLLSDTFRTSTRDDWTAVKIDGDAPARWGMLPLKAAQVQVGDHVNIIQHPGGGPKQLSLFANVIVFVGGGRIQYLTDTLPGSSGSPVFDANWNVIALHHSGGWLTEPNAVTKSTYYRNEGIAIDTIIQDLAAKPV